MTARTRFKSKRCYHSTAWTQLIPSIIFTQLCLSLNGNQPSFSEMVPVSVVLVAPKAQASMDKIELRPHELSWKPFVHCANKYLRKFLISLVRQGDSYCAKRQSGNLTLRIYGQAFVARSRSTKLQSLLRFNRGFNFIFSPFYLL